jgi:hypothetical protein
MSSGLRVKYPLFLPDFNETWIFSKGIRKNTQISNLIKILSVVAELYHEDGRTDMDAANIPLKTNYDQLTYVCLHVNYPLFLACFNQN